MVEKYINIFNLWNFLCFSLFFLIFILYLTDKIFRLQIDLNASDTIGYYWSVLCLGDTRNMVGSDTKLGL